MSTQHVYKLKLISTIVDINKAMAHYEVYRLKLISTIVDARAPRKFIIVYRLKLISTVVDRESVCIRMHVFDIHHALKGEDSYVANPKVS